MDEMWKQQACPISEQTIMEDEDDGDETGVWLNVAATVTPKRQVSPHKAFELMIRSRLNVVLTS